MDALASLRMDATSLKAILSNEEFRVRQSSGRETKLIEGLFDDLIDGLINQKQNLISMVQKQFSGYSNEIGNSMKKVRLFNIRSMQTSKLWIEYSRIFQSEKE